MTDRQLYNLQRLVVPIAVFCILFVSTGNFGYLDFNNQQNSIMYYPELFFSVISAAGPSLLLMAFGAYQLSHQKTNIGLRNTIITVILGVFVASLIFYVMSLLIQNNLAAFSWKYFFQTVSGSSFSTFDVIYVLLGVLITMPILRVLAENAGLNSVKYLFWSEIFFAGFLPILMYFGGISNLNLNAPLGIQQYFFFPLMGYWLTKTEYVKKITREQMLFAWLLTIACYIVIISVTRYQASVDGTAPTQAFYQTLQAIPCLTFFLTLEAHVCNKATKPDSRILKDNFVRLSYGVLLVAGILMTQLQRVYNVLAPILGNFIAAAVWVIATGIASYVITVLLSHVYGISKLFISLFISDTQRRGHKRDEETN